MVQLKLNTASHCQQLKGDLTQDHLCLYGQQNKPSHPQHNKPPLARVFGCSTLCLTLQY
jgi:hypothetical protein